MRKTLRALAFLAAALTAAPALAVALTVGHEAPACAAVRGRLALEASVPAPTAVVSLRVYFRGSGQAEGEGEEYFLEMREISSGRYQAVLPRPAAGVETVSYRFIARDASSVETASATYTVAIDPACTASTLSESQLRYAENLVLGRTIQDAPIVAFECEGVVAQIGANGDMTAASCGETVAASSESGPAAITSASRSGVARVAPTDRARRVVSRSRP